MPLTTHFWGWDAPVLEKAVAELTRDWIGGELNLSQVAIIVPTAEAARRLREALAVASLEKNGAVVAPHVWHPEGALGWSLRQRSVASPLQERLAWVRVLLEENLGVLGGLFPQLPDKVSTTWASLVADTLRDLRHSLGAGGIAMDEARRELLGFDNDARWRDLVVLEKRYLAVLRDWSLEDSQSMKRAAAQKPELPDGVQCVLAFAVADAPPLFRTWLEHLPKSIEAKIFVQAPESERGKFDEFGSPLVGAWGDEANVVLPLPESCMHRATGPEDQARRVAVLVAEIAAQGNSVAVGTCDPLLNGSIEGTLVAAGARVFNPAGRKARQHVLSQVLRDAWSAKHQPAWRVWFPFLRHHDVAAALGDAAGVAAGVLLEQLDDFHAKHLPATVDDAVNLCAADEKFTALHVALKEVVTRSEIWSGTSCAAAVRGFLEWIYGGRSFDSSKESDRDFGDLFSKVIALAEEVDAARGGVDSLGLAFDALDEAQLGDIHGEADLVLHGWLELLWEPARGLVIAGCNDEHLPGVVTVDAFLPDKAREMLGLSCQSRRRARDAYLLRAMWEQRREDNGLHVIFGHVNSEGDALRPSRLLLDCADNNLPARVRHLFPDGSDHAPGDPRPVRTMAFQLKPLLKPWKGETISASQLKDYLACPFRFYLRKVLRMEGVDSGQREMSAGDLGDVMHAVLKAFADGDKAHAHHAEDIAGWLVAELNKQTRARYGSEPLFSVALQIESMRQRLRRFAEVQSTLREEGWRIIAAEEVIDPQWDVKIGGVTLSGKIDRIDRNEKTGALRVIDYKTSQSEKGPAGAHVRAAKAEDSQDENVSWQCFDDAKGKSQRWIDLQLPLYAMAVAKKHPDVSSVDAAYICLPAAVESIGLKEWKREAKSGAVWNDDLLFAAKSCAEEAVRRIREGIFWPPADEVKFDDYGEMLLGDAAASVIHPESWEVPA